MDSGAGRGRVRTRSVHLADALLAAADLVLRRDGWEGLSARGVAAEAGVSKMGVYSRFGNMEGLVDALLIKGWESLTAAVAEPMKGPDAYQRLLDGALAYREWALANPQYYEAMFLSDRSFSSPEVKEHMMESFGVAVAGSEFSMAAGMFAARDPIQVAQVLHNVCHGAVSLELKGAVIGGDAEGAYRLMIEALFAGLAL